MKRQVRTLALVLALVMLLSLTACGGKGEAEQTAAPTAEPTATPEPDYAALYEDAMASYEQAENLEITVGIASRRTQAGHTAEETTQGCIRYQERGGEEQTIKVDETVMLGSRRYTATYLWADDSAYCSINNTRYFASCEEEDFPLTQLPVSLIDPTLFASRGMDADGSLLFSDAKALPEWAAPEGAQLRGGEARVSFAEDGSVDTVKLELAYSFGGADISDSYTVSYRALEELDLISELPKNAKGYESIGDIRAPLLLARVSETLRQADNLRVQGSTLVYSEAGAAQSISTVNIRCWGEGNAMLFKNSAESVIQSYSDGRVYSSNVEESFRDGSYTFILDGEESTSKLLASNLRLALEEERMSCVPDCTQLTDASVTEVGDYYLLEFSGNGDFGIRLKDTACGELFSGNPQILDENATGYTTNKAAGYLAFEKASYQPSALSLEYEGAHVIQDAPYSLSMQISYDISVDDPDIYESITDEALPDVEPEQKATPVFYEVSDEEGHKMYLFGTIHIGDDRTGFLPQIILDAFDSADALAVEFDDEDFNEQLEQDEELLSRVRESYFYTDGSTISGHIDSETYKDALQMLKATGQYNPNSESMRPVIWAMAIENAYTSDGGRLCSSKGVDHRLMRLAQEKEKPILNVESGEFQISMFADYSDELQELLLQETVYTPRYTYIAETEALYESWCRGDEAELIERLAAMDEEDRAEIDEDELALYDEYHSKMELDRNANMVEVAKGYLSGDQTVFFAVGLAHLLGEGGLVQALRDAGFTVTLISTR